MDEHRSKRVSEAVREELGEIISFEMDDPRVFDVQVTMAEVASDMRNATIKVAVDSGNEKKALAALDHAKNFLRHELAARLNLRRIPELHFAVDGHPDADSRIDFLLRRARRLKAKD
jgi:ribosome-binding factor A